MRRLLPLACLALIGCGLGGYVLSPYGSKLAVGRNEDGSARGRRSPHRGVDLGRLSIGDEVLASAPGIIVEVEDSENAGRRVVMRHRVPGRWMTAYIHLDETYVEKGQLVERGEVIGTVGLFYMSGEVVHVHLEVWCPSGEFCATSGPLRGTADPMRFMDGCFDASKYYPTSRLVLTYPFRC